MVNSDISDYITFKKKSGEILKIKQKFVGIKSRQDKTMAIHYRAPLYDTVEMERFFDNFSTIERLKMDIGDT
ncbi:MAG: hypothetical protein PHC65_05685, partial [Methanobacteriaceae archaeon]|nr:hypothetical protein [Methanobacteriaceae archaeon]MDD4594628.1 hypothetical protein [Methanobacteriaceae archaeon]